MARRQQATIFDAVIDDPNLETLLRKELDLQPQAKQLRALRKDIRKLIEADHPDAVSERGKWIRCGNFRFRPAKKHRPAGSVSIGEGDDWSCPVEAL